MVCLAPLALVAVDLFTGRIHGEWVKEVEHRIGWWGLFLIIATLAITPLRRVTRWNRLVDYRRLVGLWAFAYIAVHFLVYVFLDRQLIIEPGGWGEVGKDIARRPYITVGFAGFLLMIPLALTSTKASIRRLGRKWATLHSLIYLTALAGVVHFMWSQKKDVTVPTRFALVLLLLMAVRLVAIVRHRAVHLPAETGDRSTPGPDPRRRRTGRGEDRLPDRADPVPD